MSSLRVTVVTATWARPKTLFEHAVASIDRQTYPNIEHLIVVDGDDSNLRVAIEEHGYRCDALSDRRYTFLGRNWTGYAANGSIGAVARLVGSWMGSGDLITYLDDDNDYLTTHVAEMAELFEDPDLDFALSPWAGRSCVAPSVGNADTSGIMHRAKTLQKAGGLHPDGLTDDGNMVQRWDAAGLKWKAKDSQTFTINGYHQGAPEWL